MSRTLYFFLVFSLLSFACFELFLSTKWGIGLTPDSIVYIQSARNLLKDFDLAAIGTHYPPFYFFVLAFGGLFFDDILQYARYFHVLIFTLNAFLFGWLLKAKNENNTHSEICVLLGIAIFASAQTTLSNHVIALSEPIFITFLLLNFYFISDFLCNNKTKPLIFAAFFAALAFMTRYVGITVLIACLFLLITQSKPIKERIKNCFYFGLISGLPMFFWLLHNKLTQNQATSRSITSHIISFEQIEQGLLTIADWFFISHEATFLLLFFLVALIWLYYKLYNKKQASKDYQNLKTAFVYAITYLLFLFVSISFFDALTPLDQRILLPVFLCLIFVILTLIKKSPAAFNKPISLSLLVMVGFLLLAQLNALKQTLPLYVNVGIGYSNKLWLQSKTIERIKTLPSQAMIYSNAHDIVNLLLDRNSLMIPRVIDPMSRLNNQDFPKQFQQMVTTIQEQNGYLVYFVNVDWRWYLPTLPMIAERLPGFAIYQTEDGFIFTPPKPESKAAKSN